MRHARLLVAGLMTLTAMTAMAPVARASTYSFTFNGPGIGGSLVLTYGALTDAKYPNAFEVTGISGTFFDTNNGLHIVGAPVGSLVAITRATPEQGNVAAPIDFSRFAVATGLPKQSGGYVTYDNLVWPGPGGSPQTGSDYPPHGGFLDVYGLLFNIGGGQVVNVWSNGVDSTGAVDYGASVSTASRSRDYVGGGVTTAVTPEPASVALLGVGLVGVLTWRRRTATTAA
ncbi:MAG TPA: PEP-CTERM sorting domain-containing protein [Gemmatirosa sp.]